VRERKGNVLVVESIIQSVRSLRKEGTEPTFSKVLAYLESKGILANHRSLRAYLDSIVRSDLLSVRVKPTSQPNVRPKQVYSLSNVGPFVEAGEKALIFRGLNWTLPAKSSIKLKTDLEGLVRARLGGGTLYGSLEDAVVENLAKTRSKSTARLMTSFCASLLATKKFDHAYLLRRARKRGVEGLVQEILDEIDCLLISPKIEVEDIRSLYAIRRWLQSARRETPVQTPKPRWSLFSPDELVDVIGKQLGLK
jgi:hypothetical protein